MNVITVDFATARAARTSPATQWSGLADGFRSHVRDGMVHRLFQSVKAPPRKS